MRRISGILTAVGILQIDPTAEPTWGVTRPPGQGCWPPRCSETQLPLATPVLAHAGRLLMIGDGASPHSVYESTDGKRWHKHAHDASWGVRYKAAVSHAGAVWRAGGFVEAGSSGTPMNDVEPRTDAGVAALGDRLWVVGGSGHRDVWSSADGRVWHRATVEMPGPPRAAEFSTVFRSRFFVFGGKTWGLGGTGFWDGVVCLRVPAR